MKKRKLQWLTLALLVSSLLIVYDGISAYQLKDWFDLVKSMVILFTVCVMGVLYLFPKDNKK